jgi:hypothetical protein
MSKFNIASGLIYRTIFLYKDFIRDCGIKFAAASSEEDKELDKLESQRAKKNEQTESGLAKEEIEALNSWAQDIFTDLGVKTYGGASDEYKNFANYLYKHISMGLPKIFSEKVRKSYGLDLAPAHMRINPESYRDIILIEFFEFLSKNPDKVDDALVKARVSKDQIARVDRRTGEPVKENQEESSKRRLDSEELGFAQSYFVPKADEITLKKLDAAGEDISDMEVGSVDTYALNVIGEHKDKYIKWKFKGFDDTRINFTMPELFGEREFTISLPQDVKMIRDPKAREDIKDAFKDGTYNFKVKRVGKKGAALQFVEQSDLIKKRILPTVKSQGLDKREINNFFNIIANSYLYSIKYMSTESLGEKFGKGLGLKPGLVSEANDLAELIEMGDKGKLIELKDNKKSRGLAETVERVEENKERAQEKNLAQEQALSGLPGLQRLLSQQGGSQDFEEVIDGILDKLPKGIEPRGQGKYGLVSFLLSKPVSSYILNNIVFKEDTPVSSRGKEQPWFRLVTHWLYTEAHTDPRIRKMLSELIAKQNESGTKNKKPSKINPKEKIVPEDAPANIDFNEKNIQKALHSKIAAMLDLEGITQALKKPGKKVDPTTPTPATAPTAPGPIKPVMRGDISDVAKAYKSELLPKQDEPESSDQPLEAEVLTPQGAQKYLKSIDEKSLNVALSRYNEELRDIVERYLALEGVDLVKKAIKLRDFSNKSRKKELYSFVSDLLNKDLIKFEEIGSLSDEQADEWDANETKAVEIVDEYFKDPKRVDEAIRGKIKNKIISIDKKRGIQASEENSYKTVVAFAHSMLKSLEKDS